MRTQAEAQRFLRALARECARTGSRLISLGQLCALADELELNVRSLEGLLAQLNEAGLIFTLQYGQNLMLPWSCQLKFPKARETKGLQLVPLTRSPMLSLIANRHLSLQVIGIVVYTARDAFLTHDGCHLHDFHALPTYLELMGLSVICTGKHRILLCL